MTENTQFTDLEIHQESEGTQKKSKTHAVRKINISSKRLTYVLVFLIVIITMLLALSISINSVELTSSNNVADNNSDLQEGIYTDLFEKYKIINSSGIKSVHPSEGGNYELEIWGKLLSYTEDTITLEYPESDKNLVINYKDKIRTTPSNLNQFHPYEASGETLQNVLNSLIGTRVVVLGNLTEADDLIAKDMTVAHNENLVERFKFTNSTGIKEANLDNYHPITDLQVYKYEIYGEITEVTEDALVIEYLGSPENTRVLFNISTYVFSEEEDVNNPNIKEKIQKLGRNYVAVTAIAVDDSNLLAVSILPSEKIIIEKPVQDDAGILIPNNEILESTEREETSESKSIFNF